MCLFCVVHCCCFHDNSYTLHNSYQSRFESERERERELHSSNISFWRWLRPWLQPATGLSLKAPWIPALPLFFSIPSITSHWTSLPLPLLLLPLRNSSWFLPQILYLVKSQVRALSFHIQRSNFLYCFFMFCFFRLFSPCPRHPSAIWMARFYVIR